ncbi:MAG TPA: FAD-binding oxidoreductase [Solirubrobacteraceae bacterium]|nr:FAD-binding oxidoreductase [Solirubrobacteraceae bacterium]
MNPIDRRTFLATGAAALIAGCGEGRATTNGAGARGAVGVKRTPKQLSDAIRGRVIYRGQPGFAAASHVYNERFDDLAPRAVARPLSSSDVSGAIKWCVANGVPIRARSGGHSYAGYSTLSNGVVLDLRNIHGVSVDKRSGTAQIGAGAQLINVYTALAANGATIPAGSCPSVGITGHALGGGMGLAGRNFGLACDHIVGARIVTADGRIHDIDEQSDPDLLWALRGGGGGNFGVVTRLTMKLQKMPSSAAYFFVDWPWSSAAAAIEAWQSWAPHSTGKLTSILHVNSGPSITMDGQYFGPAAALPSLLAPVLSVPGARITGSGNLSYLQLMLLWAGCAHDSVAQCHTAGTWPGGSLPRMSFTAKSDYVSAPLPAAGRAAMVAAAESSVGSGALLCDCYGGAINRVAPSATAFVHRDDRFCIQYYGNGPGRAWVNQAWNRMRPYVSGMAYQNYIDSAQPHWQQAYYGANYARLQSIRKTVDPHHLFNFPQAIGR